MQVGLRVSCGYDQRQLAVSAFTRSIYRVSNVIHSAVNISRNGSAAYRPSYTNSDYVSIDRMIGNSCVTFV